MIRNGVLEKNRQRKNDMNTRKQTTIIDKDNKIWLLPKFIRNFFTKKYVKYAFVCLEYVNGEKKPCICGDHLKWLEDVVVETTSQKRANMLFWEYLNNKYQEYKNFIQLW